jgi:ATPase subunit of ABC transporter with duplicated ATPase domains
MEVGMPTPKLAPEEKARRYKQWEKLRKLKEKGMFFRDAAKELGLNEKEIYRLTSWIQRNPPGETASKAQAKRVATVGKAPQLHAISVAPASQGQLIAFVGPSQLVLDAIRGLQ